MKEYSDEDIGTLCRALNDRYTNLVNRTYKLNHLEIVTIEETIEIRDILDELSRIAFLLDKFDPKK